MAGDTLYLSGTVGNDPKTGVPPAVHADAVTQALANQTAAAQSRPAWPGPTSSEAIST